MISIIIPFYNEKENLPILIDGLILEFEKINEPWEIVLVNDGSTDELISNIKNPVFNEARQRRQISKTHLKYQKEIKIISHKKRLGKGQALKTGIENSLGNIIVFMDGDLQDDPKDLPELIKKLEEGYDFVNGIRVNRQHNFLVKFYSLLVAKFLKIFLHSPYTDINCGFKAFKRDVIQDFIFYSNNFRFFPLAVFYNGYKVTEINVRNNKRKFGQSKFGPEKLAIGIFDTLTAYFLYEFSERPLHFFGTWGVISFLLGSIILAYLAFGRIFYHILLYRRPILFLGMLLVIVGIQVVMTGIIGELIVYLNKKTSK